MGHHPRKRFGQNFLQSQLIIDNLLRQFHPQKGQRVIEIGPGLGAITKPLLRILDTLIAIEIDTDLQAYLKEMPETQNRLQLIDADALPIDYGTMGSHLRIIGNLPYNISTPLLWHLLKFAHQIDDMHFMLQKEVVDRLAASPGSKAYGRLTVMIQYLCDVEPLLDVPSSAFYPPPKVDSAFVRLTPYQTSPYPKVSVPLLEQLMRTAFSMRRKTIANNLKPLLTADELSSLQIDPNARPEQINIISYVQLAKYLGY